MVFIAPATAAQQASQADRPPAASVGLPLALGRCLQSVEGFAWLARISAGVATKPNLKPVKAFCIACVQHLGTTFIAATKHAARFYLPSSLKRPV
jgi:hypothetical protein